VWLWPFTYLFLWVYCQIASALEQTKKTSNKAKKSAFQFYKSLPAFNPNGSFGSSSPGWIVSPVQATYP